jgi:hypothetical protein
VFEFKFDFDEPEGDDCPSVCGLQLHCPAALEAACVACGVAGERFHESHAAPAKCNHQDLLSSLSVLPVPPGGKQRACLHGNPGVLDASRDFLTRNSCRDNAISVEPACGAITGPVVSFNASGLDTAGAKVHRRTGNNCLSVRASACACCVYVHVRVHASACVCAGACARA